jgi:hypothetical protein
MPVGSIYVGRPNRDGNEFRVGDDLSIILGPSARRATQSQVVEAYRRTMQAACAKDPEAAELMARRLRGADLACWCRLCERHKDGKPFGVKCDDCAPCHADWLGEFVNAERVS